MHAVVCRVPGLSRSPLNLIHSSSCWFYIPCLHRRWMLIRRIGKYGKELTIDTPKYVTLHQKCGREYREVKDGLRNQHAPWRAGRLWTRAGKMGCGVGIKLPLFVYFYDVNMHTITFLKCTFKNIYLFLICIYMHVSVRVCNCKFRCPRKSEEGARCLGTEVTGRTTWHGCWEWNLNSPGKNNVHS